MPQYRRTVLDIGAATASGMPYHRPNWQVVFPR